MKKSPSKATSPKSRSPNVTVTQRDAHIGSRRITSDRYYNDEDFKPIDRAKARVKVGDEALNTAEEYTERGEKQRASENKNMKARNQKGRVKAEFDNLATQVVARPKKYASGGSVQSSPKPMTLAERIAERNRRMAEAMGDAPKPKPTPPPKKPKPYADGGMVKPAVMPTPQPRPSNYSIGPLQFGGPGGYGGAGSPVGATGMPPGGPMGRGMYSSDRTRPVRDGRGMEDMKQKIKERLGGLGDRMGGLRERVQDMRTRVRPNAPSPVGAGGGYKKGGKIDGCAMRGMTKGKKK